VSRLSSRSTGERPQEGSELVASGTAAPSAERDSQLPRPVGPGTKALARMLSRSFGLPPGRNRVTVERGLRVPMSDGTVLLADHYIPVTGSAAATVLIRTPYGRAFPNSVVNGQLIAERGYHVLSQSCRGTFGSGGDFEPMRREISDGHDTVGWLRDQPWFDGRLATYGGSYMGFVQWALAMEPPPELAAAVVLVGPHDFSLAAYRRGAFDLHNFFGWSNMVGHQEDTGMVRGMIRMATAERKLQPAMSKLPLKTSARQLLGDRAPWFEDWLEHTDLSDPFWAPLQCRAALDRIAVPTLLVGGWQDLFLEQTLAQYQILAARGVPARLLVGPWAHLDVAVKAKAAMIESLAWLDHYVGDKPAGGAGPDTSADGAGRPVRLWIGESGWREFTDWPPPGTQPRPWFLGRDGTLIGAPPAAAEGTAADRAAAGQDDATASFRYDPADPTPSVGGAVMTRTAGIRDNASLEQRTDVLTFTTEPLADPVEIAGDVVADLTIKRDNAYADVFVRLCDVDEKGRSRNICDGIVRLTAGDPLDGRISVPMIGAGHRFGPGHRIRLQVSGGAHPRFARNPGNGAIDAEPSELVSTEYHISLGGPAASAVILPVLGGRRSED
jgi:uncharacterized protein